LARATPTAAAAGNKSSLDLFLAAAKISNYFNNSAVTSGCTKLNKSDIRNIFGCSPI